MKTEFRMVAASALAVWMGGCASILSGSSEDVFVDSTPVKGAACTLKTPNRSYEVVTPASVRVKKSKHDINITCVKEGYKDGRGFIASEFNDMALINLVAIGTIVLGFPIDAATGAINDYQNSVTIALDNQAGAPNKASLVSDEDTESAQPTQPSDVDAAIAEEVENPLTEERETEEEGREP